MIPPGTFSLFNITDDKEGMLNDAYNAITLTNKWDFIDKCNLSSDNEEMKTIIKAMKYEHTRTTFAYTMREMQMIANYGWDSYTHSFGLK